MASDLLLSRTGFPGELLGITRESITAGVLMGLFKGMKQLKERQKAKSFYTAPPRCRQHSETRESLDLCQGRLTAFIDLTFIDGARTQAYIEAAEAALAQGKSATRNQQYHAIERLRPSVCRLGVPTSKLL